MVDWGKNFFATDSLRSAGRGKHTVLGNPKDLSYQSQGERRSTSDESKVTWDILERHFICFQQSECQDIG